MLRKESQAAGQGPWIMQLCGQQHIWKAGCLPKLAGVGFEQPGEVHNLTLIKFAAAVAEVRLVPVLQQPNVRATGPKKLGLSQLRLSHEAPGVPPRVA